MVGPSWGALTVSGLCLRVGLTQALTLVRGKTSSEPFQILIQVIQMSRPGVGSMATAEPAEGSLGVVLHAMVGSAGM